ncbi:MAG TPA: CbiX/SirB N-terminal domain-containing protein [Casimicrobiaceae bacterium]|nr:CbiX/SirB N-terminal domain-containing protein [Casimicrobiaceae bacterium]
MNRMRTGLILFAHGARDPRWAEPFERLRDRVATMAPSQTVVLAFLEHLAPDLPAAVAEMGREGVDRVRVVPLFFGRGGHLREDFPKQLEKARAANPSVSFEVTEAAGENEDVQAALAAFALTERALAPG